MVTTVAPSRLKGPSGLKQSDSSVFQLIFPLGLLGLGAILAWRVVRSTKRTVGSRR